MADVTVWPRHYAGTNDSHGWIGLRFNRNQAIYVRMNRWAKKGVLDRVFAKLQQEQILRITIEAFGLDSTSAKVHPDGTGALSVGSTATAPTNLNPLLAVVSSQLWNDAGHCTCILSRGRSRIRSFRAWSHLISGFLNYAYGVFVGQLGTVGRWFLFRRFIPRGVPCWRLSPLRLG